MELHADLVPIDDGRWRLISQNGRCCTLIDPPEAWLKNLHYRCQGHPEPLDEALESALAGNDWLTDAHGTGRVIVIGGGLLAAETALALAQAGLIVRVSAPDAAAVTIDPKGLHTSGAAAVRAWVRHRMPTADVEATTHWTSATTGAAALVVVATDTVQPDRAIVDHLARQWLPYLVVRAHHDTAVVGPLVDHRSGPCLACLDLAMADHDPLWTRTLVGLITHPALPNPSAAHWAASQAALEAAWFVRGAGTTLDSLTLEIELGQSGVARRRWQPHTDCACQFTLGRQSVISLSSLQQPVRAAA